MLVLICASASAPVAACEKNPSIFHKKRYGYKLLCYFCEVVKVIP
jgi:hypothetical protein